MAKFAVESSRGKFAMDATGHDPSTGQFTSGQHSEAAAHHREKEAHHKQEAAKLGETSASPYGTHGNAGSHHQSAAFYHEKAAESGDPIHVKEAHKSSKLANGATKKIEKAGPNYQTAAPKPREEKTPLTSQQQSAKRIGRYLAENRIRMR
jgi:hypothetical protein